MSKLLYHRDYKWSHENIRIILSKASFMALVYCVLGLIHYIQIRKHA
jgi:hypothetical protein